MTFSDFNNDERIFVVALFKKVIDYVTSIPMITCLWGFTGVPAYFERFMSKYSEIVQETMVDIAVAEEHGLSPYVYKNMSVEKKNHMLHKFLEALDYANEPILRIKGTEAWNYYLNSIKNV